MRIASLGRGRSIKSESEDLRGRGFIPREMRSVYIEVVEMGDSRGE